MGGGVSWFIRAREASAAALIFCLLAAFFFSFLTVPALAGTETGEFCPTCPDWTNLEGWLAQKEAYENAQQNGGPQSGQQYGRENSHPAAAAKAILRRRAMSCPSLPPALHLCKAIRLFWMCDPKRTTRPGTSPALETFTGKICKRMAAWTMLWQKRRWAGPE